MACARFVWQPQLASLADDSASYLVQARVFSPWQAASAPVREAFAAEAYYPPLFPLVLAAAGAAQHFAWAHALTALLVAAWIPLAFLVGVRWLGDARSAALAAVLLACLPAVWVNAKGILSEPLYGLLLLMLFLFLEKQKQAAIAACLSALVLTRAVGLAAVLAYAGWALWRRGPRGTWPALVALAVYAAWLVLRPAATADDYARIGAESLGDLVRAGEVVRFLGERIARDAEAMGEFWVAAFVLFRVEGRVLPVALAAAVGIAALAGLVLRLRQGRADAWIVAAYLAVFLVWPFPAQMSRFLFPVLPPLLLYAFFAVSRLPRPGLAPVALAAVVLGLSLPALAFIAERARLGAAQGYARIVDWYATPDLDLARRRAMVHLALMRDMDEIAARTPESARVMWVAPAYVALLAGRRGVAAPPATLDDERYRDAVARSGTEFVFLSRYHPRDTVSDAAWRRGTAALSVRAEPVFAREDSMLLRLR